MCVLVQTYFSYSYLSYFAFISVSELEWEESVLRSIHSSSELIEVHYMLLRPSGHYRLMSSFTSIKIWNLWTRTISIRSRLIKIIPICHQEELSVHYQVCLHSWSVHYYVKDMKKKYSLNEELLWLCLYSHVLVTHFYYQYRVNIYLRFSSNSKAFGSWRNTFSMLHA